MNVTLYRQYRPRTFAALFGQDAVRTILQNALATDKLSHAYLFSGPRGTGKTTTARIVARAATCESPLVEKAKGHSVFEPCNECNACKAQLGDHAPDVVEIDAASNRGIEDIRQLREQAHYLPMTLKRKIYIIDEVHMLTTDAFNALLKTLEEPPAHCVFILATTELHKVPATIRSRCQLIRFERGSIPAITAKLDEIVTDKKWKVEKGVTELIAIHAAGGFRDAETQLEQLMTRYTDLTKAQSIDALGITSSKLLEPLVANMLAGNLTETRDCLTAIEVPDQHRCEMIMAALIEHIRKELHENPAPSNDHFLTLTDALTTFLETYILIKGSPFPKLVLESACYEVAGHEQRGIKPVLTPQPVKKEEIPQLVATPVAVQPQTRPAAISISPRAMKADAKAPVVELRDVAVRDVRQAWKEAIKSVSRESAPLAQMLREAVIFTAEDNKLVVHSKYKFHVEKLAEKKNCHRVEALLEEITHDHWHIEYQLKDTLPRRNASTAINSGAADAAAAVFGA
jgi:DNA polymerase III subunit gamma/tau